MRRLAPPALPVRSRLPAVALAAVLLLGAGCQDLPSTPEPSAKETVSPPSAPAFSIAPGTVVATGTLPGHYQPDPNWWDNHGPGGLAGYPSATVPARGWYRVRIEGEVTVSLNPTYAEVCPGKRGHCPPDPANVGVSVGPEGIMEGTGYREYGPGPRLRVGLNGRTPLSSGGGAMEFLVWAPQAGYVISPDRKPIVYGYCWERCWFAYTVAGSQDVTVTTETSPLQLEVARQGTEMLFEIKSGEFPLTSLYWRYAAGDTSEAPHWFGGNPYAGFRDITACRGQTSCTYPADKPGRMYVYTRVLAAGGGYLTDAVVPSSPVGVAKPELVLTCNGSRERVTLTRGERMDCRATANPSTARLEVRGWNFQDEEGNQIPGPTGGTAEWGGTMVVGGRVIVAGTVGGEAKADTVIVTVKPREWSELQLTKAPLDTVGLSPQGMQPYPKLGSLFGAFVLRRPDFKGMAITPITDGPNEGISFMAAPVELPAPKIYIHPALHPPPQGVKGKELQPWHRWYLDQNGHGSGTCAASGVAKFRANVERHEGVTMAPDSHYGKTNEALLAARLQEEFEKLHARTEDAAIFIQNDAWTLWQEFEKGPYKAAQTAFDDSDKSNVYNIGCTLDFSLFDP